MSRSTRFATILLIAGAAVLLLAVAIGERMGSRVIGQATEQSLQSVTPAAVTPAPDATPAPYGPDWKRSQALSAAGDPHFPDPRVPPQPLPTLAPTPTPRPATPTPPPTPTPNPNIPVWRRSPFPSASPTAPLETPSAEPTPEENATPPSSPTSADAPLL